MALTADEQKFFDFAKKALPRFLFADDQRPEEMMGAFAKVFDRVRIETDAYFIQTLILTATGAGSDYLNQHAIDRDTSRQAGETDAQLRERLRFVEDALTRPVLQDLLDAILTAAGFVEFSNFLELRRDRAYFGSFVADTGTGGRFSVDGGNMLFEDDGSPEFQLPIEVNLPRSGAQGNPQVVLSGASSGGNDGTFPIDSLSSQRVRYINGSGVGGVDAGVTWTINKRNVEGIVRDGFNRAYFNRGYRMGGGNALHTLLPFGCDTGLINSVTETLRQKKGAGIKSVIECMDGLAYPITAATLSSALTGSPTGAVASSIYRFTQTSGSVLDLVGSDDLTPVSTPVVGVDSEDLGSVVSRFDSSDDAFAAASGIHNFGTDSFAVLIVYRATAIAPMARSLVSKRAGGSDNGWEIFTNASDELRFIIDSGASPDVVVVTPPATEAMANGTLRMALAVRDATGNTVELHTNWGTASVADTQADLDVGTLFHVGEGARDAFEMDIAYLALFDLADAEALGQQQLSNFHSFLGLGHTFPQ